VHIDYRYIPNSRLTSFVKSHECSHLSVGALFSTKKLDKTSTIRRQDVISCKFNARCVLRICSSPRRRIVLLVNHHADAVKCPYSYAGGRPCRAVDSFHLSPPRTRVPDPRLLPDAIEKRGFKKFSTFATNVTLALPDPHPCLPPQRSHMGTTRHP